MGLWQKLTGELIDIVEWRDERGDVLVHRFERYNDEIKHGAKLVVREGQAAVFVNKGQTADVFVPGTYTLTTDNLPLLTTLMSWPYGFKSPFKAEVYFVSTKQFTDLKWGTKNPVMLRDPEFGPVRLRAFGTYAVRVTDPNAVIVEIVATQGRFTIDEITNQLRNEIVARFTDVLGESRIPILDLAASYDELGKFLTERIKSNFTQFGFELTRLFVENISLPPEVEATLDKRTSMGIIGDLGRYTQYQTAEALGDAARQPGGGAGAGVGLGAGFAMGQQMMQAIGTGAKAGAAPGAAPPPLAAAPSYWVAAGDQQTGPFELALLQRKIQAGEITATTLVWQPGMASWTPAGQVGALAAHLGAAPPPLPK